ncbi:MULTISPECIES: flagellar export chaperone FliS [unclassified Paenibacillus]|uniref:flagellar export chaperone FliS n=1 Tax=unclassified Paenibacillus TaxID=185978 RepID=UPI0009551C66|nr:MULTISPECIES: flagellar export chaperone FliS [unclassified Paenibacillus]ASS67228.1 flagellar export chaperone FliS [Paenibacillus sp. RUD330]SIQ85006.1 flagellar protein FliS [Paenibacillus sp. RU4X]SIR05805.1 flagellar protein FliS [Paenibacillus sp. RU4T]
MIQSPYQKYQQLSAQTATPIQLVLMLYDGAIRFTKQGIMGVEQRNYELANNCFCKAEAILHELIASLNFDYPLSSQLVHIYEYMLHQLIQANIGKDPKQALEVVAHLTELRESWKKIAGNMSLQQQA